MRVLIAFLWLALLFSCAKSEKSGSDSNTSPSEGEGEGGSESIPSPTAQAGQLVLGVSEDIDPETVSGYVVGQQSETEVKRAGDQFYIDNVPEGDVDVVIVGALRVDGAGLTAEATHGIRFNDIAIKKGENAELGTVELPEMGRLSGTVKLIQPADVTDHAGVDIYIPGTEYIAKSDIDGKFTFTAVPVGAHNLFFDKDGYARGIVQKIEVKENASSEVPAIGLVLSTDGTGGLIVNGGKATTDKLAVNISVLPTDGAVLMKISEDPNFADTGFKPLVTSTSYTFESGGNKTLYIQFADANGQNSSTFKADIGVDTEVPSGNIKVQEDADKTSSRTVSIQIEASDDVSGVAEMILSEKESFAGASYVTFSKSTSYELSSGDGVKTIYLRLRDGFNRESETLSATIILDTTHPTILAASESPPSGATDVDYTSGINIAATFSENIPSAAITSSSVTVTSAGGATVYSAPSVSSGTDLTAMATATEWEPATTYTVTITTDVEDEVGNSLTGAHSWSFTTKSGWRAMGTTNTTAVNLGAASIGDLNKLAPVAADGQGNAMIGYAKESGGASQIFIKKYDPALAGFGAPIRIDAGNATGQADMRIVMNDAGDAAASWLGVINKLMVAVYDKASGNFGTPVDVANGTAGVDGTSGYDIDIAPNGDIIVGFLVGGSPHDMYANIYDASTPAWGGPTATDNHGMVNRASPRVGIASASKALAAWTDNNLSGGSYYRAYGSVYNGTTWNGGGAGTMISFHLDGNDTTNALDMDMDDDGKAYVLMLENNDAGTDPCSEIGSISRDECHMTGVSFDGTNFGTPASIFYEASTYGFSNLKVIMYGANKAVLGWSQSSGFASTHFDGTSVASPISMAGTNNDLKFFGIQNDELAIWVSENSDDDDFVYRTWDVTTTFNSANVLAESSAFDTAVTETGDTPTFPPHGLLMPAVWYNNINKNIHFTYYK